MTVKELQFDSLARAMHNTSIANYVPIIKGFVDKGVPIEDVRPRENVFTYRAWRALDRQVRKGETGIKIVTWIPIKEKKNDAGEVVHKAGMRPKTTAVFHISQTELIASN